MKRKLLVLILTICMVLTLIPANRSYAAVTGQYTNPLMNGADPTVVRGDDGYFYSGFGTDNDIYIKRSETLLGLSTAESHLVWKNPNKGNEDNNKNYYVWGPYIYRLNGAWYIYYSSSTENDFGYGHPSSYVLENTSIDPFEGEWVLKGSNTNVDDFEGNASEKAGLINTESYGLVCGVITINGEQFFTYTKYDYYANEPGHTKFDECPTIVRMENPWTLTGPECTVARPTYSWEKVGDNIDEGCAVLEHDGKVYFAYSASSYTKDGYSVGLSVCDLNDDLMVETNWKKSTEPLLKMSKEDAAFGPGSPLFVKSPDGTEDWLIYHAGPIDGQTATDRRVRACLVNWTDEGQINLGTPSNPDTVLDYPSGEDKSETYEAEDADFVNVTKKLFNNTAKASGSGYMMFDKDGEGYIEFNINSDKEANYSLGFRYNNIGASSVPAAISVNGQTVANPEFKINGNYAVDLDNLWIYNIKLNQGENRVRVTVDGKSSLNLDSLIIKRATKYNAVDARLANGAFVENGVDVGGMYNDNASLTFSVSVPVTGAYSIKTEYANGFEDKNAGLYVNGVYEGEKKVSSTGSWSDLGTRIDNVYLHAGVNEITFKNDVLKTGNKGDVNYYSIVVTEAVTATYKAETLDRKALAVTEKAEENEPTEPVTPEPEEKEPVYEIQYETVRYEAEDAELENGASKASDHAGYSGECFVGGMWNGNASITFTVNTDEEKEYEIKIGYGNGGSERHAGIKVNGEYAKYVVIGNSGNWDTWAEETFTVNLNKGENTITIYNNAEENDGVPGDANYDYIELSIAKEVEVPEETPEVPETPEIAEIPETEPENVLYKSDCGKYTVTVESEALYDLTFNYGNNNEADAKYVISVNGNEGKEISFNAKGKKTVCLKLNKGANVILISKISESETDSALTLGTLHLVRRLPWIYQAECGTLSGVSEATDHILYNGTGFVGGFEQEGNSVTFNVNVATSGTHTETLRYSGAWDHDITMSLYVNGVKLKQVSLEPSSNWDDWKEATEEIYLRAGKNTIEFRRDAEDSGSFNIDQLTVDKYSTGETTFKNKLISGEVYVIKSILSNMAVDVDGLSQSAGAKIHLWSYVGGVNQKWKFYDFGNGYYGFKCTLGSKFISVNGNGTAETADKDESNLSEQWTIEKNGEIYVLRNRATGKVLEAADFGTTNDTTLRLADYTGEANQLFTIDGGIGTGTTEVRELTSNLSWIDGQTVISNYTLVDPYIPNKDEKVTLTETKYTEVNGKKRYEAEEGTLEKGASLATDHDGYSGEGFVGGMYNGNASIAFNIGAEASDTYVINLRYCNGFSENDGEKIVAVYVNEKFVKGVKLDPTGDWNTWGETSFEITLPEGVSKVSFLNNAEIAGAKGDVNYDYIEVSPKEKETEITEQEEENKQESTVTPSNNSSGNKNNKGNGNTGNNGNTVNNNGNHYGNINGNGNNGIRGNKKNRTTEVLEISEESIPLADETVSEGVEETFDLVTETEEVKEALNEVITDEETALTGAVKKDGMNTMTLLLIVLGVIVIVAGISYFIRVKNIDKE